MTNNLNKPILYLMQNHENDRAITLKENCGSRWNNAWICRRHGNLDLKLPNSTRIMRYIKGEIENQGFVFSFDPRWETSHNQATCCMGGVGYEGRMRFGSVEKAVCFLKKYYTIIACGENTKEHQAWIDTLTCGSE